MVRGERLALFGGAPVRADPYPPYNTIGAAEKAAVARVLDSGVLSGFVGEWTDEFFGGAQVRATEAAFAARLGAAHAVTLNSATTALEAAVQAVGVAPGDEVIVPPYTMSASAAAILRNGAIPRFADVEDVTFGLDPAAVAAAVTPRTRAIVVVHLFGHPARMRELLAIAERHDLRVIEDAAQSIGATYHGRETATLGDAGVLSLNRHKIIQCGEGGLVITDDPAVARRVQLVRNHGEVVADAAGWDDDASYALGSNYRMTEVEAAIAEAQLGRLAELLDRRRALAARLATRLGELPGVIPPRVMDGCTHSYYLFAVRLGPEILGRVDRARFCAALRAEGVPVTPGYVRPLYLQTIYQRRSARAGGFPWSAAAADAVSYAPGINPVVERLYDRELLWTDICRPPASAADVDQAADAFAKVLGQLDALAAEPGAER